MQFNSEANQNDLVSDRDYWAGTSDSSYPIRDKTRNANFALDRVLSLIQKSDWRWQYDDTNQTGELLDTNSNLVANTQKYALTVTWLKIARVRIKDAEGNWKVIPPIDRRTLSDGQLTSPAGMPTGYDKLGNYLYFYPTPSHSSSGGIEVQFQRGSSYFTYTDTTKVPGFATQFHRLISLYAALDFCQANILVDTSMANRVKTIQGRINGLEEELTTFYSSRDVDDRPFISVEREDYGQDIMTDGGDFNSNPNGF